MHYFKILWLVTLNGCFWNLMIALAHWAGLIRGTLVSRLTLALSLVMIILVIINTVTLAHHPQRASRFRTRLYVTNIVALFIAIAAEWY